MTARNLSRWLLIAVVALALVPLRSAVAQDDQGAENLISNPSFEGPYSSWGGIPEFQLAPMWNPWWVQQTDQDPPEIHRRPEYKPADAHSFPGRVHSGNYAQQYFTFSGTHIAGLYQQVSVPAGAGLRFSIYVQAWSCGAAGGCPDSVSHYPADMHARIGIDPQGRTDPFAPEIVWSNFVNPLDAYQLLTIEAVAAGPQVTVYTYSAPDWPVLNNDIYWDDASLTVVAGPGSSPSRATPRPTSTSAPGASPSQPRAAVPGQPTSGPTPTVNLGPMLPTQPAQPDGSIIHVVQRSDTLAGISRAYDIPLEELMRLNGLTGNLIFVGDELLIRPAPEPTPTPTASPTPTPTPTTESESGPSGEGSTGQLCVTTYDDVNGDGVQGEGEDPLIGVVISLDGQTSEVYTTGEQSDPHCFGELPPGEYNVTVEPPEGYALVGSPTQQVALKAGSQAELSFGLRRGDEAAPSDSQQRDLSALGLRVGALLAMALAGGLLAFFVAFRVTRHKPTE
jgi:LysM repeat protein